MATELVNNALAVNAWGDDSDVIVAVQERSGYWHKTRLTGGQAVQLADQLRLLTGTSD